VIPASTHTTSPEGTKALGAALAEALEPGDVVLLLGGLGAGKTTFVQGVAEALGVTEDVTSPTFTLCQVYSGALTLLHADLWRLERLQEVIDLAFDEGLEQGGVLLVEWGEGADPLFGDDALVVSFEEGAFENERIVTFSSKNERWAARLEES
jgi:tRNA threonylcarbamoyladenosine biosynthesis protein TsaE